MRWLLLAIALLEACSPADARPRGSRRGDSPIAGRVTAAAGVADGGDAGPDGGDAFVNDLSLDYDGVDEYVVVADTAALEPGANFSFAAWVKEDALASADGILMKWATNQQAFALRKVTNGKLRIDIPSTLTTATNNCLSSVNVPAIVAGAWYFVVVTYDGAGAANIDRLKHYVNGVLQTCSFSGTIPAAILDSTSDWVIGGGSVTHWGPGNIDQPMMWNTTLDQAAVTALWGTGRPNLPSTTGLQFFSYFGDYAVHPTVADVAGVAHNGTMTNMEAGDIVNDVP